MKKYYIDDNGYTKSVLAYFEVHKYKVGSKLKTNRNLKECEILYMNKLSDMNKLMEYINDPDIKIYIVHHFENFTNRYRVKIKPNFATKFRKIITFIQVKIHMIKKFK